LADGNRRDNTPLDDFIAKFFGRPVCDRPPTVLRRFARHCQDRRDLLGCELAGTAAARQISEKLLDGLDEDALRLAALHHDQGVERIRPPTTPNAHRMAFAPKFSGNFLAGKPLECQQNHPGSLGNSLGTGAGTRQSDQHLLLTFRDRDPCCPPWHCSSLLDLMETGAVHEGMAKNLKSWKVESARES
jgi:hypothetical protein